jgi:adenylate kinase family enzyme
MKITIIGHAASGKTTLAKKISQKLNIPHIHLDRFWFEAGGLEVQKGKVDKAQEVQDYIKNKVQEFIHQDNWVSDGFFSKVQPLIVEQAERLIFIDIPLHTRIINHIKRVFFDERHPELNRFDEFIFIFEIIKRTIFKDSKFRNFIKQYPEKLIMLKSYKEVDEYLKDL